MTATPIPTAMTRIATATRPVHPAVTAPAIRMRTSVTAPTIAAPRRQRKPVVPTASTMTATPMLTAMTATATATRLAPIVCPKTHLVRITQIAAAATVVQVASVRNLV